MDGTWVPPNLSAVSSTFIPKEPSIEISSPRNQNRLVGNCNYENKVYVTDLGFQRNIVRLQVIQMLLHNEIYSLFASIDSYSGVGERCLRPTPLQNISANTLTQNNPIATTRNHLGTFPYTSFAVRSLGKDSKL